MANNLNLDFHLHPKQSKAFCSRATEILYGGAAGGGKSYLMRCAAITWSVLIPGLQVYIFRRTYSELIDNHMEGPKGFRALLSRWEKSKVVKIVDDDVIFKNGSRIFLCHCQHPKDRFKYDGSEIHVLFIDELTHFPESIYRYLRGRLRMIGLQDKMPDNLKGMFPRIMCSTNPGNVGHLWVKRTFVDFAKPLEINKTTSDEGGLLRQFIPALIDDNPTLLTEDPGYEERLQGLGSKARVYALRYGDWNVIDGAFFDCWDPEKHIVEPFKIPDEWTRFRSMDWGSASPFSVGWWAVVSDNCTVRGQFFPRGALIRYREWYGADKTGKGLKMTAHEVGKGILVRDHGEKFAYSVLDPSAFAQSGGPSIAEELLRAGVTFRKADNKRVGTDGAMGGWDQVRSRLNGIEGVPMVYVFSTCSDLIRTLPALQHDEANPEDVMTDAEDHAPDEMRYACMSRPFVVGGDKKNKPSFTVMDRYPPTMDKVAGFNRR